MWKASERLPMHFNEKRVYYKSISNANPQTRMNKGFSNVWGSRGLEFESQHSDQKRPESVWNRVFL